MGEVVRKQVSQSEAERAWSIYQSLMLERGKLSKRLAEIDALIEPAFARLNAAVGDSE